MIINNKNRKKNRYHATLTKHYNFRADGYFCCSGFSWNESTGKCESKDIKDIKMMIMTILQF